MEETTHIELSTRQKNDIFEEDKAALWHELRFLRSPLQDLLISDDLLWQERLQKFYFQKLAVGKTTQQAKDEIIQFILTHINCENITINSFTHETETNHLFTITIKRGKSKIGDIFLSLSTTEEEPFKRGNNLPLFSNSVIEFLITYQNNPPLTSNDIAFAQAEEKLQLAIAKKLRLISCPVYEFKPIAPADNDSSFPSYLVDDKPDQIAQANKNEAKKYELERAFLTQIIQAKNWCIRLRREDRSKDEEYKIKLVQVLNNLVTLINEPNANQTIEKIIRLAHELDHHSSHSAHLTGKLMLIVSLLVMMGIFTLLMTCPLGPIAAVTLIAIFMAASMVAMTGGLVWDFNKPTELAKTLENVEKTYKDKMPTNGFSFNFFNPPAETKENPTPPPHTPDVQSLLINK